MANSFVAEEDTRLAKTENDKKKINIENQRLGYRFGVLAAPGLKPGTCGTELHVYVPSGKGVSVIDPVLTASVKGQWIATGADGEPKQIPQKVTGIDLKRGTRHISVDVCALPVEK